MSLYRHRPPHQFPCVPTSLISIHIPDQTFRLRRSSYLTAQLRTLRPVLLRHSSVNGLPRVLSPVGWPMKYFGSLPSSTYTSPIHELSCFVWNLAMPIESVCSLPSIWLTFEVAICEHVSFAEYARCMYIFSALIYVFPVLVPSFFVICSWALPACTTTSVVTIPEKK